MSSSPKDSPDKELIKAFEAGGVIDYLQYLQSTKTLLWTNFKAGVAKGFGITIGATVVIGLLIWLLAKLVALPFVGEYFGEAEKMIEDYAEKTNYTDEFEEMIRLLQEMRDNAQKE